MTARFSPGAFLAPAIDWLNAHFHPVVAAIGWFVETVLTGIEAALLFVPWYGSIAREAYGAQEFLGVDEYENLMRWVEQVGAREAVKRGRMVNRTFGGPETQLRERHSARDFEINREDMVEARGGERV